MPQRNQNGESTPSGARLNRAHAGWHFTAIRVDMHSRTTSAPMSKTKQMPHATAIDLAPKVRSAVVAILNQQLANLSDLQSQTLQAHWNVRGQEFYQLHKLFEDLAEPFAEHIDTVAERAVTIGGFALGTVRCAANSSDL